MRFAHCLLVQETIAHFLDVELLWLMRGIYLLRKFAIMKLLKLEVSTSLSDEQRPQYENLILLCYSHHVETDDVNSFPEELWRKMKLEHEATFEENNFKIDESLLYKNSREMD
jgi:hypothetical protein